MKILVAIQSSENADMLAHTTLRWAGRAGYNMRIFIPDDSQREDYEAALLEANHEYYLDIPESVIEIGKDPVQYAKDNQYDLVVFLPEGLSEWNKENKLGLDKTVIDYAEDVGRARSTIGKDKRRQKVDFGNGAVMKRIK